jgi:two-component system nitrogen regulation sensor histidine kinase GlnL
MSEIVTKPDAVTQIGGLVFALLLLDDCNRIAEVNHAAENMLGRSTKRLAGKSASDVIDLTDKRVAAHLFEAREAALVARDVGLLVNGQERRVNFTLSPLAAHPGWRVMTLSDTGRDDAVKDENGTLASMGAPSILAHEIKNPLAAIRGAAQLVERKLPDKHRTLAKMIRDEVDRIARLIDRMQRLGSTTPEPIEPSNLHEAIRTAIGTVRAASKAQAEIVEEFDPSIPPVLVNRDALEQVFINLISNACDAAGSDEQDPQVTVRTRFVSGLAFSAIRYGKAVKLPIEITIIDNGNGVPRELRDHVFEPFVTSKKSGQGLGLALVRKLLSDMDGRISHERDMRADQTHFRIHLPMAPLETD